MAEPVGRPTEYKPEYCKIAQILIDDGASMFEVAYELGVSRATIYRWIDAHKEFRDTVKDAKEFSEGWWMKQGRLNLYNKDFSSTLWYMNMKNRFGWADKQETNITATLKQEDALKELE